jgi:hypothetical protein
MEFRNTEHWRRPGGLLRIQTLLEPQAQTIEAPCRRPADERTEDQSIEERADGSKTRTVVVPRQEPNAFSGRDVLPVPAAFANDRKGFSGAESQSRGAAAVRQIALSYGFTLAAYFKTETDPRRISKSLRLGVMRFRQVIDPREAKIPSFVQCRRLRVSPKRVHRRPNKNLYVDAHRLVLSALVARFIATAE